MVEDSNNDYLEKMLSATTKVESQVTNGSYFGGFFSRAGVDANDVTYNLVTAGSKELRLYGVSYSFNFSNTTTGTFRYLVEVFLENSDQNDWTATGGAIAPAGRPLNGNFINNLPLSTLTAGVGAAPTGVRDYLIFEGAAFVDTSGNDNELSAFTDTLFRDGRSIIIPANTTALIRATTTGTAGGTHDIESEFFFAEI